MQPIIIPGFTPEQQKIGMRYRMQVDECTSSELKYVIWLGEELSKMPLSIQKRWVRKRVEQEYGSPIKNPTQKRYLYESYFSSTELMQTVNDGNRWDITVSKPTI
jgi:hypothetical protein